MRLLLIPQGRTIVFFHLLSGLIDIGCDVSWVGPESRWPAYLLPLPQSVKSRRINGYIALKEIGHESFDAIVLCERPNYLPQIIQSPIPKVLVDSTDPPHISINDLRVVSTYFKSQLPRDKEDWMISDRKEGCVSYRRLKEQIESGEVDARAFQEEKILPFPYSTFLSPHRCAIPRPTREVFFLGWDSGGQSNRREIVSKLKSAHDSGIFHFSGGLFRRGDLRDEETPPDVLHPKIKPLSLYFSTCKDFRVNIVPRSNGQLSFRLYELLSFGCFVLAEESDNRILPREPEDREHLVFFKHDLSDLVDLTDYYLNNERERDRIARAGFEFYWGNLTPSHMAQYFMEQLRPRLKELPHAPL